MADTESKEDEIKRLEVEVMLYELRARKAEAMLRNTVASAKLKELNAVRPKSK